jgi:hypothetical protein
VQRLVLGNLPWGWTGTAGGSRACGCSSTSSTTSSPETLYCIPVTSGSVISFFRIPDPKPTFLRDNEFFE